MTLVAERRVCPRCAAVFRAALLCCPLDGAALEPYVYDPLLGAVLADRYRVLEHIGEGGMGRVYRVRHTEMPREFALKVLFGDIAADENMRARFRREAEIAATLDHPNIASVVDFGEAGGLLFLAMELVEGPTLRDRVAAGPLSATEIAELLRQIAAGLAHAHKRGMIHRDLKADNVIVAGGDAQRAKIVDFGIAISVNPDARARLTTDGLVVGTPSVMSPEQLVGEDLDQRSDLFSLGVVLYELLAGVPPFDGPPLEVAQCNLVTPPPPIAERAPDRDADPALEALALKLMAKRPEDRYQSATAVIAALDRLALGAAPTEARPIAGPTRRRPRRWPLAAALIAAIAIAAVAILMTSASALEIDVGAMPAPPPEPAPEPEPEPAPATAPAPAPKAAHHAAKKQEPAPKQPAPKPDLYESRY